MKAKDFPQSNAVIAADQKQYNSLPAFVDQKAEGIPATLCFELEDNEVEQVMKSKEIWLTILTFGRPFPPIYGSFEYPFSDPREISNQSIWAQMLQERKRQLDKFGVQNVPCVIDGPDTTKAMHYNIPTESQVKKDVDERSQQGKLTYADIAFEEFCEAVYETDLVKRRKEVLELMTVCFGWIEKIDAEIEKSNSDD